MKKNYSISLIFCLLTYFEARSAYDHGFISRLRTTTHDELVRTLHEPGLPAALATLTAGLTSFFAYRKMASVHHKSEQYKQYERIHNIAGTLIGPLLLLTAITVSDEEQRLGTFGARTIALWSGIPLTIVSLIYWLLL